MSLTNDAQKHLIELYRDLSVAVAELGCTCSACGACCHFESADHILYATDLEIKALVAGQAPAVVPPPVGRCPYQMNESCHGRGTRPLGCRLHFCEASPTQQARLEELSIQYHKRLQDIHEQFGITWSYRPVLEALEEIIQRAQ